uniref:NADH dehydrogenase subunit 6 n=1 Tax=Plectus sambesii TaxID=2011161 RepID=A0A914VBP8_9BILA
MIASNSCFIGGESSPAVPLWGEGYGSSSGFFIFTGIVSLLFVLAILAVYLLLWGSYESDSRLASL